MFFTLGLPNGGSKINKITSAYMLHVRHSFLLTIALLAIGTQSFSTPDDQKKLAQIFAGSVNLDLKKHRGEYIGGVRIDQGTTHLRATRAITESDAQNKLIYAVAFGKAKEQAYYCTQPELHKPIIQAYANIIRYYPIRHIVELIGDARIIQGKNSFHSPKIFIDTLKQHITAKSNEKQRTLIIIQQDHKSNFQQ